MTYSVLIKVKDYLILASDTRVSSSHADVYSDVGKKLYYSKDFNIGISFAGTLSYRKPNHALVYLWDCFDEFIQHAKGTPALSNKIKAEGLDCMIFYFMAYCVQQAHLPRKLAHLKALPGMSSACMLFQATMVKVAVDGTRSHESIAFDLLALNENMYKRFGTGTIFDTSRPAFDLAINLILHNNNVQHFISNKLLIGNINDRFLQGLAATTNPTNAAINTQQDKIVALGKLEAQSATLDMAEKSIQLIFQWIIASANLIPAQNSANYYQDKSIGGGIDYVIFDLKGNVKYNITNSLKQAADADLEIDQKIAALSNHTTTVTHNKKTFP